MGRERLQRGHPAAAADLRRTGPHRHRLRAVVLDARPSSRAARAPAGSRAPGRGLTIDVSAAERAIAEHRPDVVFITTPNNPTGNAVPPETVLALY
ncbi:aminotransferase class I/II-fold pyridoxal phosphate-dependent enzyme [Streptomyces tricolor]|nr:aminotransferase class I/II-fold pyridoxal phosphate-dependent enzyme [Streptomyces tricolor]